MIGNDSFSVILGEALAVSKPDYPLRLFAGYDLL